MKEARRPRDYDAEPLRIAMLGMIPENHHPYSWSAIINGYDADQMALCPAPSIPEYLGRQPKGSVRIPFANVTHIWTDDPADACQIAAAARIPHIVTRPEAVIGQVDLVIIATDDGDDHVRRAEPFVSAGLPVFVDKPMATNIGDLAQFVRWRDSGAVIVSSSGLRFAPELSAFRGKAWRWLTATTCKSWERYGIHVLEPLFTLTGPGFSSVRATRLRGTTLVQLQHGAGMLATIGCIEEGYGSSFIVHAYGDHENIAVGLHDRYAAFRAQLMAFLGFVAGRSPEPFPFADTVELMAIVIAGRRSIDQGGVEVKVQTILDSLPHALPCT